MVRHIAGHQNEIRLLGQPVDLCNGVFQVLVKDMVYATVEVGITDDRETKRLDLALGSAGNADQAEIDANGLRRQCGHSGLAGQGQHGPSVHG